MSEYRTYVDEHNKYFAVTDHQIVGGPYDTEDKVKRRIRDLKRRDAQPSNIIPQDAVTPEHNTGYMPSGKAAIGEQIIKETGAVVHTPMKLAASSMYGHSRFYDPTITTKITDAARKTLSEIIDEPEHPVFNDDMAASTYARRKDLIAKGYLDPSKLYRNGYRPAHRANRLRSNR